MPRRRSGAGAQLRASHRRRARTEAAARRALILHLHGYDIETRVAPGKPAVTAFTARLTGRFPVAIHAGDGKRGHRALLHVEIYPR
jgi:hypothetical protein